MTEVAKHSGRLGALITALPMVAHDIGIGRRAFGMRWETIPTDFDPRRGNHLALGMAWIFLAPVVMWFLLR